MVLVVDFDNERRAFGAADKLKIRWFRSAAGDAVRGSLDKALPALGFDRRRPSAVAVMLGERSAVPVAGQPVRNVSWSTVRAAVAAANTLAFAWNVPVITLRLAARPTDKELLAMIRKEAGAAETGNWAAAVYSGEPNITKPKRSA